MLYWEAAVALSGGILSRLRVFGAVGQVVLNRGDVLAIFSDGVTEAMNREGDEFGEARLADVLVSSRGRPASEIADRVILEVKAFSGGDQHDDLTLVVVRGR
jgi:phosphoserine phosphatase RsbU/P